jgi:hypothetical protein
MNNPENNFADVPAKFAALSSPPVFKEGLGVVRFWFLNLFIFKIDENQRQPPLTPP